MEAIHARFGTIWKTTAALGAVMLIMTLVNAMNREGFEERFGYDAERLPDYGMSDTEIEACHLKTMIDWFGSTQHHHQW